MNSCKPLLPQLLRLGLRLSALAAALGLLSSSAVAQKPQAAPPQVYLNTTYNLPTGGTTWAAHTASSFASALTSSQPGDVIVLDAGVTYSGNFVLPAKANSNHKWIYIISSGLSGLAEGTRVSPANAAAMAKIVTPNAGAPLQLASGSNYWRLAGLEVTSASNYGCQPNHTPPINCFSYYLIGPTGAYTPPPDSITVDRSYLHGSPTIDLQRAIPANLSNFAVIDSYIDDIHMYGVESQGVVAWWTPGPMKITNNFIAASTENILFGGGGGWNNPYVPSDIEIRNNYLYKPLSWVTASVTNRTMVVKDAFECKSCQRLIFDSNIVENVWANAQNGYAVQLTVLTSQSGDRAVNYDLTITNNIFKNVVSGFDSTAKDYQCGTPSYPNCHNAGDSDRWVIADNLITFYDPTQLGGLRNNALAITLGADSIHHTLGVPKDIVFQHNTTISSASTPCWESIIFSVGGLSSPPPTGLTYNLWFTDNALCSQVSGDWGDTGTGTLTSYMGMPNTAPYDLTQRYYGNVMYVPSGTGVKPWPAHNYATTVPFTYVDPTHFNYQLLTPYWTDTSDGNISGIQNSLLP